jgi:hypothetical protein
MIINGFLVKMSGTIILYFLDNLTIFQQCFPFALQMGQRSHQNAYILILYLVDNVLSDDSRNAFFGLFKDLKYGEHNETNNKDGKVGNYLQTINPFIKKHGTISKS